MDLADEITVRRIAPYAVLVGIGPAHAAPDIAVDVGPHAISEAGREVLGEYLAVGELAAVDIEHPDVGAPAMSKAAVDDVELRLVRRECKPVGLIEIVGHNRHLAVLR